MILWRRTKNIVWTERAMRSYPVRVVATSWPWVIPLKLTLRPIGLARYGAVGTSPSVARRTLLKINSYALPLN